MGNSANKGNKADSQPITMTNHAMKNEEQKQDFEKYVFPFENAIFEGGPANYLPYVGAIRVLEEVGAWRNISRLGGCGSGALLAALLSVGYNSQQLEKFFQQNMKPLIQDHCCGTCCLGRSLTSTFGWNQNKKIIKWLGSKISTTAGKPDVTFLEVYEKFGKELCIVVTNVTQGSLEYCHHKTTPNLSIVTAVRMSLATPGLMAPIQHQTFREFQFYVSGASLCDFPIHCYDGWWLSDSGEGGVVNRLTSTIQLPSYIEQLSDHLDHTRFTKYNTKTIGFVVYDDASGDPWTVKLDDRNKTKDKFSLPQSRLAKSCAEDRLACKSVEEKYHKFAAAANKILPALGELMPDQKKLIERKELNDIFKKMPSVTSEEREVFFCGKLSVDDICQLVAPKRKTQVCRTDFLNYAEKTVVSYEAQFKRWRHYPRRCSKINNLTEYLEAVESAHAISNRYQQLSTRDLDRTIGINVRYLTGKLRNETLEDLDKNFLLEQGKLAAKAFIDHHMSHGLPEGKGSPNRRSFCRDDLPSFIDDDVSEIIDERDYMENLIGRVI